MSLTDANTPLPEIIGRNGPIGTLAGPIVSQHRSESWHFDLVKPAPKKRAEVPTATELAISLKRVFSEWIEEDLGLSLEDWNDIAKEVLGECEEGASMKDFIKSKDFITSLSKNFPLSVVRTAAP